MHCIMGVVCCQDDYEKYGVCIASWELCVARTTMRSKGSALHHGSCVLLGRL